MSVSSRRKRRSTDDDVPEGDDRRLRRKDDLSDGEAEDNDEGAGDGNVPSGRAAELRRSKPEKHDEAKPRTSRPPPPPPYQSRSYWEKRYARLITTPMEEAEGRKVGGGGGTGDAVASVAGNDGNGEARGGEEYEGSVDALPGHSWYFTYEELRPLLLPLLLGRDEIGMGGSAGLEDDDDDDGSEEGDVEENGDGHDEEEQHERWDGWEEVEENEKDEGSRGNDAADEINEARPSATGPPRGPQSVVELGCGDVPLGSELWAELMKMQKDTGASAKMVVDRIVCTDYSAVVIDALKRRQKEQEGYQGLNKDNIVKDDAAGSDEGEKEEGCNGPTNGREAAGDLRVDYLVADARSLPFPDRSFNLVMEKGTLDAMLSDKEVGVKNCVEIVAEMARVCRMGGYLLIVSHLNAHAQHGLEWLQEVVIAGLRASWPGRATARDERGGDGDGKKEEEEGEPGWVIEVHGSDDRKDGGVFDSEEDEEGGEDDDENDDEGGGKSSRILDGPPSGGPGPAVYIVHKTRASSALGEDAGVGGGSGQEVADRERSDGNELAKEDGRDGHSEEKQVGHHRPIALKFFAY